MFLFSAVTAPAQPATDKIDQVRFEGATSVSDAYMLGIVRSRPGAPISQQAIDQDVVRLLQTGKFLTAASKIEVVDGKTVLTFEVRERPRVQQIVFEGNSAFTDDDLRSQVPLKPGEAVDLYAIREGKENILFKYHSSGFGYASVEVDEESARSTGQVVYRIEEGAKVRVRKILFEGNTAFNERELSKHIQTKTSLWVFRRGVFDPQKVASDAAALQNFYRREGYLDARVSYRVEPGARAGDLHLVFTIVEGVAYAIETVRVEGNTVLTTEDILSSMRSKPGDIFKQTRLDTDVTTLRTSYGKRGYIYATVRAVRVFSTTPGLVVVTIQVTEGEKMTVGRIVIRGNESTQDKVVRRALNLFPQETFDLTQISEAEKRLRQTQLFERVTVTPAGDKPHVRDIIVNVAESEKTTDLVFAFGVTSDSGLVGSIVLTQKNFDIFDRPRNFSEFLKFRAFRGAGERLRLELQPGTELNRFRLDFTEPYLFDQPIRFDLSLYHFTRNREAFDEQRTGSSVSFGKRLENGLGSRQYFKNWYGEVSFRAENVELGDVDIFDDSTVRDSEDPTFQTSVKATVVRDRTDNRHLPTSGDRISLSYEQFVGDDAFGKFRLRYARHKTVFTDVQDRKSVLSFRAETGIIAGNAPVFEKFFAGGIGSIRGFDFRGVGPVGGLKDDPIGGDFLVTGSTEYSFPLAGNVLRGVAFMDMGTVESDIGLTQWRTSIGFGLRMTVEVFGPVPIELDFAAPISKGSDDDTRVFSFFIGGSF